MTNPDSYYTNRVAQNTDLLWQVGKTVGGQPVDAIHLDLIVNRILGALHIERDDIVADFGCGNGLITRRIAQRCHTVLGIEKNKALFESASINSKAPNLTYMCSSIEDLNSNTVHFNKAYLYEVAQHINYKSIIGVLETILSGFSGPPCLFIGGIPDEEMKWAFYNTQHRRKEAFAAMSQNSDPIGYWYHKDYFLHIAERLGLKAKIIDQDARLYTSHYRFDCVFSKDENYI